jgi:16S rRNA (adenine1518-N6/adenine1519-N6)-dimethyltransferase
MNGGSGPGELPPLREVVRRFGLEPKKSLGQNFLFDLNLTAKIARAAGPLDGVTVFEVGPGPGGLTRALLAQGARVVAVERDERCLDALAEIEARYPARLRVVAGDAMSVAPERAVETNEPFRIVSNLPYNVGTALLTKWIEAEPWPPQFDRLVLMFQREVAERIVATPEQRSAYGRLAVLCGWRTTARILFDVPAAAFTPPPKVTSSVVELVPKRAPLACSVRDLAAVTMAAFGQRRKMLRQSLRALPPRNGKVVEVSALLERAHLAPTSRAEEVSVEDFVGLAMAWADLAGPDR